MTISNSKTWIKLNQIDCESRFNLNWLLGSRLLPWLFDHIIICTIPKSRINDHFYSHHKDTAEKDREHIYLSSNPSLILTSAAIIFVINNFYFLFFHTQHNRISKIKQNKTADTYLTSQGSIKREGEREGQQEHKSHSFK